VADPERRLAAVPPPGAPAPARGAGGPRPGRRERIALAVLAGLLAVCAIGLAGQLARNARLEGRVAELSGELASTRATLDAYQARLEEVRGSVARLHALVQGDPQPAEPRAAAAPAPDPR
jgi:hypothetical protein